jgi:hypothetical protein
VMALAPAEPQYPVRVSTTLQQFHADVRNRAHSSRA